MKQEIIITVDVPDHRNAGNVKNVFRCVKLIDNSVELDLKAIYHGLRLLYDDSSAVITFKFMP